MPVWFASRQIPLLRSFDVAKLRWILLGWAAAEVLTFLFLLRVLGFGPTVLLGLATTVLGVVQLRRVGGEAMRGLRRGVEGAGPPEGALLDGLLAAFGAVLLVLPGFLANAVGLMLAAPSARLQVAQRFGARVLGGAPGRDGPRMRRPAAADVIDLSPEDWRPVDRP